MVTTVVAIPELSVTFGGLNMSGPSFAREFRVPESQVASALASGKLSALRDGFVDPGLGSDGTVLSQRRAV